MILSRQLSPLTAHRIGLLGSLFSPVNCTPLFIEQLMYHMYPNDSSHVRWWSSCSSGCHRHPYVHSSLYNAWHPRAPTCIPMHPFSQHGTRSEITLGKLRTTQHQDCIASGSHSIMLIPTQHHAHSHTASRSFPQHHEQHQAPQAAS